MTDWLSAEEQLAWRAINGAMLKLPATLGARLEDESELSYVEYHVLAMLSERPDLSLRISDLAAAAHAELSRISHLITRMDRRGLVRRTPDPTDGRYTLAVLTAEGRRLLESAAPGHVTAVRELVFDLLSPAEVRTLYRVAERITARLNNEPVGPK